MFLSSNPGYFRKARGWWYPPSDPATHHAGFFKKRWAPLRLLSPQRGGNVGATPTTLALTTPQPRLLLPGFSSLVTPAQAATITAVEFYLLGLVDTRVLIFGSAFPDQARGAGGMRVESIIGS